ncbi:MAG TPA: phosphotransferase [Sporichthya sp.]|nr:phosphotransferase [Sporichthya sp.]
MNPKAKLAARAAVVGALSIAEKVRRPVPTGRGDVPVSGAHVTAPWLTAVLCRDTPGAQVVSFARTGGSRGTSERVGLRVEYNEAGTAAGLPTAIFTKATADFKQRMLLGGADVIAGETQFFMGLRQRVDIEAPQGYWAAVDARSWRSITVLEDIAATKGATFLTPTTGFTKSEIVDLVQNLGRLHGPLWGDPALAALKTPKQYAVNTDAMLDFRKRTAVGMQRSREVMPPALLGQADRLHDATGRSMELSTNNPHGTARTLLHGDCHAGQTYRTAAGAMGLCDWQGLLQGNWAFDVAYLINTGCEPDDRKAWQDDLLTAYLDALSGAGGPRLSFSEALLTYRQHAFWPYTAWAFTIGRAFYQPKMQPVDTCLAMVRRTATAIHELDALEAVGV